MAIPVISAATLEKFSILLNGAPLMITGDQSGTATAANPTGLRVAGGNLFRDYTPWTEFEITDWSQGFGHRNIGENGFLWGEVDSSKGNALQLPPANTSQVLAPLATPSSNWNGYNFWESKIFEASNGKLYSFFGYQIFEFNNSTNLWASWYDIRNNLISNAVLAVEDSYIIDMCEHNGFLIVVTKPYFRSTEPAVGSPPYSLNPPLINEFAVASDVSTGSIVAYPNVFAISLADKAAVVLSGGNKTTGTPTWALPLAATATAIPGTSWLATNLKTSGMCATACFSFSGYLFIGGSAGFMYTNGDAPEPGLWVMEGWDFDTVRVAFPGVTNHKLPSPTNLSTKRGGTKWVTGFAGIKGGSVGEFYVYMSTTDALYLLDLAVPTIVRVMEYNGSNLGNGRGMVAHNNDIYIPVYYSIGNPAIPAGGDVLRFTQSGQTINVGLDQTPYTPEVGMSSPTTGTKSPMLTTLQLATGPNMVIAGLYGYDDVLSASRTIFPRVAALKGQGWHAIQSRNTEVSMDWPILRGIYYRPSDSTVHYNLISSKNNYPASQGFGRFTYTSSNKHLASYGNQDSWIWLGWFDAGAPLLQKDWHSISIYGDCLDLASSEVEVRYEIVDEIPSCGWQIETFYPATTFTYDDDTVDGEYIFPTVYDDCASTRAGKYLGIAIRLKSTVSTISPVIRGIKLKYFVPIEDYFRFSYSVSLPSDCLTDCCGEQLYEYTQADWDEAIRAAACSVEPVPLRDIDGRWYLVRVENASRRINKVTCDGESDREFDITWSLQLVQLKSATICGPDWEPAVCP